MFNMEDPVNEAEVTPAVNILDISTDPQSIDEVKMAIAKLKNGKATDIDQISAELFKTEDVWATTILKNILQNIWVAKGAQPFGKQDLRKVTKKGPLQLQQL